MVFLRRFEERRHDLQQSEFAGWWVGGGGRGGGGVGGKGRGNRERENINCITVYK